MIWFLQRESDLLICEIRRSAQGQTYEFEVAPSQGPPETHQYTSPRELIDQYLRTHVDLTAQGWRPMTGDLAMLA